MEGELVAKCSCDHCENHIAFPLEAAGAKVNCPHCGQITELNLLAAPPPASDRPSAAELVNAFEGVVAPTPVSTLYRMSLILVTVMMVLLPLVYLSLIGAASYAVFYYATHFSFLLHSSRMGLHFWLIN